MTRFIFNGNDVPETIEYSDFSLVGKSEYCILDYAYKVLSGYLDSMSALTLYMFDEFGDLITNNNNAVFVEEPYAVFMTIGPMEKLNDRCHFVPSENFENDKPEWVKHIDGNKWVNIKYYMAYIDTKANQLLLRGGYDGHDGYGGYDGYGG
ncbi:hypothetical protein GGI20_003296 [Coemansia sp. BCRC 34301]|nr:hypothetical protein GGI20_003296 [Coemansia sp. BCRC 34301]